MWSGQLEYIVYEFVHTLPAVSRMYGSPHLDDFQDGWLVSGELLVCEMLTPGFVQYSASVKYPRQGRILVA